MVNEEDISAILRKVVSGRKYALVFHDQKGDIKFLQSLNIELDPNYVIDTQELARGVLGINGQAQLKQLVHLLRCPKLLKGVCNCKSVTAISAGFILMV